jgi:hypothetical protein
MLAALLLPTLLTGGAAPPADAIKLNLPRVQNRSSVASATRAPWIDANGWRILRNPGAKFVYDVKGETAALAAAEAFTYGADALIAADDPGAKAFGAMVEFLKTIPAVDLAPVADFGVVDDGSNEAGELINLLTRMNLLYKIEKSPDTNLRVNVRLGTKEYPVEEARNPGVLAHRIRSQMGDDQRSLRIYGSEVVVGRLMTGPRQARVLLLNYSTRPILGMRVRVRGAYSKGDLKVSGIADTGLADWTQDESAAEFTIPELRVAAIVDLSRK